MKKCYICVMKKINFIIILLFLCSCGRVDKIETVEEQITIEKQSLTEEESWKLFDEFWMEFQNSIITDDTNRIKELCEFESKFTIVEGFIENISKFKKYIEKINKDNNYYYLKEFDKTVGGITFPYIERVKIEYENNKFNIRICTGLREERYITTEMEKCKKGYDSPYGRFCHILRFNLINNKYKLTWYHLNRVY